MPLFELYRMTKQKLDSSHQKNPLCSTNISSSPEKDIVSRNGEISMQDQFSKAKRNPFHTPNSRDKDVGNGVYRKIRTKESEPHRMMGLSEDDDDNTMLPWLTYPMDQSLQSGYSCDFLNDFATTNDFATSTMSYVNRSDVVGSAQNGVRSKRSSCSPMVSTVGVVPPPPPPPPPQSNKSGVVNFSHFLRPTTSVRANNNNNNSNLQYKVVTSSPSIIENKNKEPVLRGHHPEPSNALCREDGSNDVQYRSQSLAESANKELQERSIENVVASSSVCSGNGVERCPERRDLKRRHSETDDSECPSEEVDEESLGVKRCGVGRVGSGSKRSRAAEVHNLSERRRRDRINEKMRSLQELIPNCNKVDKASMLDEAIEYLKTLQLQVQVLSMGAGLYMPSMMLPTGIQPMHPAYMAHLSSMGVGMGFGMSMPDTNGVSSGFPTVQGHRMHTPSFSGPLLSDEPTTLHGMAASNHHLFGMPSQGLSMPMPHAPLVPTTGGYPTTELNVSTIANHMESLDSAITSSSKDPLQNISSQMMHNTNGSSTMNQNSTQRQTVNETQLDPAQDSRQVSEATGNADF